MLFRAITMNLELVKAKYQNQKSSYTATHGFKCNPAYRSYYLQLKGLANRTNKLLTAVNITLPREIWGENFTKKACTRIKNSLRRILAEVLGEHGKYAVYSFERSKNGTYHLHGLIVVSPDKVKELQTALRKIADSAPNSVLLKGKPIIERLMSRAECRVNAASWGKATLEYPSSTVTRGFADYISKDLGKRLGDGTVRASIVTINPGQSSEANYAAYKKARHNILSICAKRIEEVLKALGPHEFISSLINELPILRQFINMMTGSFEVTEAA
jgi:hypothetical protein